MLSVIIPAAGSGTRMNQALPKALTPFKDSTFLKWQLSKFENIADEIYVVVSDFQLEQFDNYRRNNNLKFEIINQGGGRGSFFAIKSVINRVSAQHTLVCWVDQVGLSKSVILRSVIRLMVSSISGLIPLLQQNEPYVRAVIDSKGCLIQWKYQREGDTLEAGYTDLGFFVFNTSDLRNCINGLRNEQDFSSKLTGEFNFLDLLPYFSRLKTLELYFTDDDLNAIAVNTKQELSLAEKKL